MIKYFNIKLKDEPNARLNAIKAIKDNFGFTAQWSKIDLISKIKNPPLIAIG